MIGAAQATVHGTEAEPLGSLAVRIGAAGEHVADGLIVIADRMAKRTHDSHMMGVPRQVGKVPPSVTPGKVVCTSPVMLRLGSGPPCSD